MRDSAPSAAAVDMSRFAEVLGEARWLKARSIDRAAYPAGPSPYLLIPAAVVQANSVDEVTCGTVQNTCQTLESMTPVLPSGIVRPMRPETAPAKWA